MPDQIVIALVSLVFLIVVVFICRELLCWYWKINQGIKIIQEVRDLLVNIDNKLESGLIENMKFGNDG